MKSRKITPELEERIKNRLKTCTVVDTARFYNVSYDRVRELYKKLAKEENENKPERVERPPESPVHKYDYSKLSDEDKRKYENCERGKKVTRMAW